MPINDFKPFAAGPGANVTSQADWENLPALLSGFMSGKASSAQMNKAFRQASFIAAALAQFVSEKTDQDVLDDGDLPGFVEKLTAGFAAQYLSRSNPFGDIASDGPAAIATALSNLGLGGIRYVKQRGSNANGKWAIWSDGSVEVFGTSGVGSSGLATVTFPISLPGISHDIAIAERLSSDSTTNVMHVTMVVDSTLTASGFQARSQFANGSPSTFAFSWRVIYAVV